MSNLLFAAPSSEIGAVQNDSFTDQETNNAPAVVIDCRSDFSIKETLLGGQAFRWRENEDGSVSGTAFCRTVTIYQEGERLLVYGDLSHDAHELWSGYLDMSTDYEQIMHEAVLLEPRLEHAARRRAGIHILRQEPWEALCSFIISQNNNIPRIRRIIEALCALCGAEAQGGSYSFPDCHTVASLTAEQLTGIGCGYRADYILAAAALVCGGSLELEALRTMPIDAAREQLLKVKGIGPKVADCFLLYGLHRLECFPKDVWIKRAIEGEFKGTPLQNFRYAGVAQQYIFEYIQHNN